MAIPQFRNDSHLNICTVQVKALFVASLEDEPPKISLNRLAHLFGAN